MTLDEWLTATGTKEDAFAAEIGTSQAAVNRYRHRRRTPRRDVMVRIARATGGLVTVTDFHREPDCPSAPVHLRPSIHSAAPPMESSPCPTP